MFNKQVPPNLLIYDAACQTVRAFEQRCPGLLANGGKLPRLPVEAGSTAVGRVVLPHLAHLGNHSGSASMMTPRASSVNTPNRVSDQDVYALKHFSLPQPTPQSQVDEHNALYTAAKIEGGGVGPATQLAATRALSALRRDGVSILSLFEVLVFSYHWHVQAAASSSERAVQQENPWHIPGGHRRPPTRQALCLRRSPLGQWAVLLREACNARV